MDDHLLTGDKLFYQLQPVAKAVRSKFIFSVQVAVLHTSGL